IQVEDILRFESELYDWLDQNRASLLEEIRTTGNLPDDEKMKEAIQAFKKTFVASEHQ
ncbi:F0F1 ATP synthase subunit alpha, partial [Bacillus altitudinis]|nr:F0F1 ATP synthase subunit alpha [Bacillus altitudinis]